MMDAIAGQSIQICPSSQVARLTRLHAAAVKMRLPHDMLWGTDDMLCK